MSASEFRSLLVLLLFASGSTCLLLGWTMSRVSARVLFDDRKWPRSFPYPDRWLLQLNNFYDEKYPARDGIKLHGEIPRVQFTLLMAMLPPLLVWSASCATLALRTNWSDSQDRRLPLLIILLSASPCVLALFWPAASVVDLSLRWVLGLAIGLALAFVLPVTIANLWNRSRSS